MPIEPDQAGTIVENYEIEREDQATIGVLGSHSALEIGYGAKQEDLDVLVVCERVEKLLIPTTTKTSSIT